MKDLSREEKLEQEILRLSDEYGNKKWLRVRKTFFVIVGALYLLEVYFALTGGIRDISIDLICGFLFAPMVVSGFVMFISYGILFYIIDGSMKEEKIIAKKIGELEAIKSIKYTENE